MLCKVTEITKSFRSFRQEAIRVLERISLSIDTGESVAVVGPSGSGKTTLLNIVSTLDRPDSGSVNIDGEETGSLDDDRLASLRNRRIGVVFQRHLLLPHCTLLQNVLVPTLARPHGRDKETDMARALRLIERVGLSARLHHRPGQLSGGECQRAAVVRALINSPALLCADEPTGSLDRKAARSLGQLLSEINREENTALLVVTHSEELASCMDRRMHLEDGVLVSLS